MARVHVMNLADERVIEVVLSRRNLLSLLHKLDMPGSARMFTNNDCREDGVQTPLTAGEESNRLPVTTLVLRAEDDGEHYARRPTAPGEMHPLTEQFVRRQGGWSRVRD